MQAAVHAYGHDLSWARIWRTNAREPSVRLRAALARTNAPHLCAGAHWAQLVSAAHFLDFGTFEPARRASDRPIAIACLRLRTFRPERPLLSLPRFISCIARFTFLLLALPYLRAIAIPFLQIPCEPQYRHDDYGDRQPPLG
jgi:hypothetical protein